MNMTWTQRAVLEWLATGETGASSMTMAYWLAFGLRYRHATDPCDPDDLRRCIQLLDSAPTLRHSITRMGDLSPQWAALVTRWVDLEQLIREEAPNGWPERTYALMRELRGAKS